MGFPHRFPLLAALATSLVGLALVACSADDDPVGEKASGEVLPSPVVTGQSSPDPPSTIIADDLLDPADMSQGRATPASPAEPISDERPAPPVSHTEEANPQAVDDAYGAKITGILVRSDPPPVEEPEATPWWRPLSDDAICDPGDRLKDPENRFESTFVCMMVVGADDCLEIRGYPSFEGEALDCVPNGTRLLEDRRDGSGPLQREDGAV